MFYYNNGYWYVLVCVSYISDRKFGIKARLNQALGVTLAVIKNYVNQPRVLLPVVQVLKVYSSNGMQIK